MVATNSTGDWATVIAILGGSWLVRLPIFAIGVVGLLWTFRWLARSTMHFNTAGSDRQGRMRAGASVLLIPYIVLCVTFSLLSLRHPLGSAGTAYTLFKYWLGYSDSSLPFS